MKVKLFSAVLATQIAVTFCATTQAATSLVMAHAPSATAGASSSLDTSAVPSEDPSTINKVKLGFMTESYVGAEGPNTGEYNYFTSLINVNAKYKLSPDQSVRALLYFTYNMVNDYSGDEWGSGDFAVEYRRDHLPIGDLGASTYVRLYLPTSEYAYLVGQYDLSWAVALTQPIDDTFSLIYALNLHGYAYTRDQTGQRFLRAIPTVALAKKIQNFQPYLILGEDSDWRYNSDGSNARILYNNGFNLNASETAHYDVNNDLGVVDLGAKYQFNSNFKINIFYEWYHFWHGPSRDAVSDGAYELDLTFSN